MVLEVAGWREQVFLEGYRIESSRVDDWKPRIGAWKVSVRLDCKGSANPHFLIRRVIRNPYSKRTSSSYPIDNIDINTVYQTQRSTSSSSKQRWKNEIVQYPELRGTYLKKEKQIKISCVVTFDKKLRNFPTFDKIRLNFREKVRRHIRVTVSDRIRNFWRKSPSPEILISSRSRKYRYFEKLKLTSGDFSNLN